MKPEDFTGGVQIRARLTPISAFASLFSLALLVAGCATGPRPLSTSQCHLSKPGDWTLLPRSPPPHRQLTFLVNCRRILVHKGSARPGWSHKLVLCGQWNSSCLLPLAAGSARDATYAATFALKGDTWQRTDEDAVSVSGN